MRDRTDPARIEGIDRLRGLAVAMMIAYHFCWDLTFFRLVGWRMLESPAWIAWRAVIVSTFLFVVGLSLALRAAYRPDLRSFVRRWVQIAAAAAIVTVGTLFQSTPAGLALNPRVIYFGVLHHVALALWIGRACVPLGRANIAFGIGAIALGLVFSDALFEPRSLNWIGFSPVKPRTEDYVPLFPWIGVVLVGLGIGIEWRRRGRPRIPVLAALDDALPRPAGTVLGVLGRFSLSIYLAHQPVLIGLLWLVTRAI